VQQTYYLDPYEIKNKHATTNSGPTNLILHYLKKLDSLHHES